MTAPAVVMATPAPVATAPMATAPGAPATRSAGMAAALSAAAVPRAVATGGRVWWVLDPDDDAGCVRGLLGLHDVEAGRVVCHPRPGATWTVLVEDVLRALGKHPQALARERRTREGPRLLRVWLRAEQVSHLVVLRAHRLGPAVLTQLVDFAAAAEVAVWLVWHHHDPPPTPHPRLDWAAAVTVLGVGHAGNRAPDSGDVYAEAFTAARAEARSWRPDGHRLGWRVPYWEHAWPGCDVGALLQRLTIGAATPAELGVRLEAAQDGFAAEGRHLVMPDLDPDDVGALGPRLPPETIERLRQLACPVTAAAVMLGLATDAEPRFLAGYRLVDAGAGHVPLLAGNYRVPERAYPLLRAAILAHDTPSPGQPLLARPGTGSISPQCLAHLVRRGATLTKVEPPPAARPSYGINPATRFASDLTSHASITDLRRPLQL